MVYWRWPRSDADDREERFGRACDWRKEEYEVSRPGRTRIDFRQEIGRANISIGIERGFAVLDPDRAELLRTWVSALIQARGERPGAGEVGAWSMSMPPSFWRHVCAVCSWTGSTRSSS